MIRSHAIWALARSLRSDARIELEQALARETVSETLEEIEFALAMIEN
jgi:hypothetical protein